MKKIIILFVLIFFISFSYAQLSRFYLIDLPKYSSPQTLSRFQLKFFLCNDGRYYIHLEEKFNGTWYITGYTFSIGKYEVKKDVVLLTDSYTGSKMSFQLNSSNLKPLKVFPFMSNLVYNDFFTCSSSSDPLYSGLKETTVEKFMKDFESKNTKSNPFKDRLLDNGHFIDGVYRYEHEFYVNVWLEVELNKNKTYEFRYKTWEYSPTSKKRELDLHIVISAGTWERKGNILTLWDINLQHKFYGLIRENGIEFLFFRWVEDMVFKKINN
jgi:hypothetical protein